jgi:hypothetical protein
LPTPPVSLHSSCSSQLEHGIYGHG